MRVNEKGVSGSETDEMTSSAAAAGAPTPTQQQRQFGAAMYNMYGGAMPFPFAMQTPANDKRSGLPAPEVVTGYTSADEVKFDELRGGEIPKFVRKWFDLNKKQRATLYQLRQKWIDEQVASTGNKMAAEQLDVDEMKKIMPKFAAKWFALSDEDRERYKLMKRQRKLERHGLEGTDIPPFAAKWFALPQRKKNAYRKIKHSVRDDQTDRKDCVSDGDQSDLNVDDYMSEGMPRFAAKWFTLPHKTREEIRIKYRCHRRMQKQTQGGGGLSRLFARMGLRSAPPAPQYAPMMHTFMPAQGMSPYMSAYHGQAPMYPYTPQPYMHPTMMGPPPFCVLKKFYRQQAAMMRAAQGMSPAQTTTDDDVTSDAAGSSSEEETKKQQHSEMPRYVKQWFKLPMQARMELRMYKQQLEAGSQSLDALPQFARKWFSLSEREKQKWRQQHRHTKRGGRCNRKSAHNQTAAPRKNCGDLTAEEATTTKEVADPSQVDVVKAKSVHETCDDIPQFAHTWFALPVERKCHYRMLNRYLQTKTSDDSDTSDDDVNETMPPFAAQWFALTSDERQHLRTLKHKQKPHGLFGKKKPHFGGFPHRHGAHPWQHWAPYHAMPAMTQWHHGEH